MTPMFLLYTGVATFLVWVLAQGFNQASEQARRKFHLKEAQRELAIATGLGCVTLVGVVVILVGAIILAVGALHG